MSEVNVYMLCVVQYTTVMRYFFFHFNTHIHQWTDSRSTSEWLCSEIFFSSFLFVYYLYILLYWFLEHLPKFKSSSFFNCVDDLSVDGWRWNLSLLDVTTISFTPLPNWSWWWWWFWTWLLLYTTLLLVGEETTFFSHRPKVPPPPRSRSNPPMTTSPPLLLLPLFPLHPPWDCVHSGTWIILDSLELSITNSLVVDSGVIIIFNISFFFFF